jgi:hypothetical protein
VNYSIFALRFGLRTEHKSISIQTQLSPTVAKSVLNAKELLKKI